MSNIDNITEIWTNELTIASKSMSASAITGIDPPNQSIEITMQVPQPLYQAIWNACNKTGIDHKLVFSQMASVGFKKAMTEKIDLYSPQHKTNQLSQSMGLDMTGITSQLAQMQSLIGHVSGLQEMIENVQSAINRTDNITTPKSHIE